MTKIEKGNEKELNIREESENLYNLINQRAGKYKKYLATLKTINSRTQEKNLFSRAGNSSTYVERVKNANLE